MRYAAKAPVDFALLSDENVEIIRSWGLVNPSKPEVPHPTAVIVDRSGTVRFVRQDVDYRRRPSADELLAVLDALE